MAETNDKRLSIENTFKIQEALKPLGYIVEGIF
jgi:hypothetical protein